MMALRRLHCPNQNGPVDAGPMTHLEEKGFDIVANFSAHKHVRSEKDIFSVTIHMPSSENLCCFQLFMVIMH